MKFIKKLSLVFVTLLLCLIAAGTTLAYFFEDEIGAKVVQELSKQLKSDLRVKKVELSVFSSFPKASVNLKEVTLEDNKGKDLLTAEQLSFRFGLFSLFSDNIKVHSVKVSEGTLNIAIDTKGEQNYDILKPSAESSTNENLSISLDEAELQNILLRYQDDRSRQKTKTKVSNALFSGKFASNKFALKSQANLFSHYIEIEGERFLQKQNLSYDAIIDVDLDKGTYGFEKVRLKLNENEFIVDGQIDVERQFTNVDILLTSDNASLESVIQLLPEEHLAYFGDFSTKGNFNFELWVQGNISEKESPGIEAKFGLKNGELRSDKLEDPLKNLSFDAKFTNGQYKNNKTSVFEIDNFKGSFASLPVELSLMVYDLDDPKIDFKLNGALPLESIYGLLNNPLVTDGDGEIKIKDLEIKGRFSDMQSITGVKRVSAKGTAVFEGASLMIKDEKIAIEEGQVRLDGNTFTLENLQITGVESSLNLEGTCHNLLPVLLADSLNTKKAELTFEAKLKATHLDLARIVALADVPVVEKEPVAQQASLQVKGVQQRQRLTSFLKGTFNAEVTDFTYNKIVGENFEGQLEFDKNEMLIKGKTSAMEGEFDLDGKMIFADKPYLKANLVCKEVNIKEFFRQTDNFGQEVLQEKHIAGKVNSKIIIQAYFDEENNFLHDKLKVLGGIGIHDGYLKDFQMLESFSDFVKIEDLKNIRFTDMQNWLEIKNRKIYIPSMFIQSNALNLHFNGEYSFDNDLDFNVKVNAGQVLVNLFKRHDRKLNPQPAQKDGFFNLYYKIYGNIERINYKMNKKEVKQDLARSEHLKLQIKNTLKKEFGSISVLEAPEDWKDEGEKTPEPSSSEEEEYIEGFDR